MAVERLSSKPWPISRESSGHWTCARARAVASEIAERVVAVLVMTGSLLCYVDLTAALAHDRARRSPDRYRPATPLTRAEAHDWATLVASLREGPPDGP